MSSSSSALASPSTNRISTFYYDVLLTVRFTKHTLKALLRNTLRNAGINVFIDDPVWEFPVDEIIKRSGVGMVIFTPEFLKSDLCLLSAKKILVRSKSLLPVFWGVTPLQVRKRLVDLPFSGFTLPLDLGNDEKVVSNIMAILDEHWSPYLRIDLVGLKLRVREVLDLLEWKFLWQDTIIFGIWGARGIGKTTIARAIYDRIGRYFEGKCFLSNINHAWQKDNGLALLQNQLISDISKSELDEINDVEMSLEQMKQVLNRRVLVVLDDVNLVDQLTELCVNRVAFGKGSLILITARNKDILDHFVDQSYEMKKLDSEESRQLFEWHAHFRTILSVDRYGELVTLCEGVPLVLEVIGSLMCDRTKPEWENVLNKLKEIQDGQIQKKLKVSLDFLTDLEKDLFFNIACFYVGQNKSYVTQLLKDSRFPVEMGMHLLMKRRLVKVINHKIHVHDLLQEIGSGTSPYEPKLKYIYDVFLSFRGEDVRKAFATHLYTALKQAGIEVFMDEERIERGKNISSSLLQAIESSKMAIIIFSKNYAGSSWCLQELEKIMECHKTTYQEVLPIFYDVQPSEVRKQQNAFGQAWKRLIMRPSTSKAKKLTINFQRALTEAANLSGWDMQNYRTEAELINHVIETITMKLVDNKRLFVAQHPVGLKSRMKDIIQSLYYKSNEVIIIGIWGMGGIGKTTVAKAIYNKVGENFEGKSFLANVREVWKQSNSQVHLQEQLLSGILKTRRITSPSLEMGKTLIKGTLCHKRVLVVLDDVNNEDQLQALCGSHEWFGPGSRIIITTRDEHLLKILRVTHVYSVKEMDDVESLELFSWHAFKQAIPKEDLIELSGRVVSYSGGLPLALEILGSYLFDKEIPIWESVLEKLQQIPNDQIHKKLKISYDNLSDHTEKSIFLDICCFFVGKDKSYVIEILNGCQLYAKIGINRLIELSLVKVDNKNKLDMHDLLRDMGKEIIREQSPQEPEKRSRLWFQDDVLDVLKNNIGTIAIRGLSLNMSRNNSLHLSAEAFKEMKRLCLLHLDDVQLVGDYGYLSKELRWLCWHGFPLENMPVNLCVKKTVAIELKWSNLTKVWKESQLLEWLKVLNLSHSHHLIKTPDFLKIPKLEKLILKDCPSLSLVHPSIGNLKNIVLLNLKDCKSLNHLPRSVYNLKSLKTFNLSGCSKIVKLEEDIEQMESLAILVASQTSITQVPFSLVRLKSIKYVSLCGYEGLSRDVFPHLVLSWMSPTNHSKSLLRSFGIMPSLIKVLSHPLFAKSHEILKTRASTTQASGRKTPTIIGTHQQVNMQRSETFMNSLTIHVGGFNEIINTLLKNISQVMCDGRLGYSLPKNNYPDWLAFKNEGSSISFIVPQVVGRCLKGIIFYIIYSSLQDSMGSGYPIGVMIKNFTKATMEFYKQDDAATSVDEEWKKIVYNLEPGNEVEIIVNFAHKYIVMKTAIYLVYVEETSKMSMSSITE